MISAVYNVWEINMRMVVTSSLLAVPSVLESPGSLSCSIICTTVTGLSCMCFCRTATRVQVITHKAQDHRDQIMLIRSNKRVNVLPHSDKIAGVSACDPNTCDPNKQPTKAKL